MQWNGNEIAKLRKRKEESWEGKKKNLRESKGDGGKRKGESYKKGG